ncbi:TonB-dependent outer membrane receptor [Achromobacter xylosoxidans]|uniref:TonB-dependent siderophore receptor n=2 Tax=Alcaligenes xylosoxydans xylosoxydans TaxID=85698 RepID=UPI0006AC1155|nr:TonB-dependent siderophore receptor [Achromobacter xylosoxidans]KOQ22651.1 TonB-dependent outer membrane receptor [Achromobacter xylosoxidans]KOQ30963.1 TonB-dependent outer membrane receptor [Achromobacter xylosoxidans]KOQ35144.1 TonB-dependent outer membrane receptor [Achromobacter xylosoxidans]KOQ46332.1 TonB-dependent outer membrane receptor [Achromobacter xylosoxidans]KOQ51250.1 TonB-dependent outer membrane receptor [Achromobacter xylosoxidans]
MHAPTRRPLAPRQDGPRLAGLALALLSALAGTMLCPAAALAQPALQADSRAVDIPAGPLGPALAAYAQRMRVLLSFRPAQTDGLSTPGLSGSYAVEEGFARLLSGTALRVRRLPDDSYALEAAAAEGISQLAAVTVLGAGATTEGTGAYTADWMRSANGLVLAQRDTPQSTSIVTRQQLDDQAMGSVRDVMENATGMNVQQSETDRLSYYSRGFQMDTMQFDGVVKPLDGTYQFGEGNLDPVIYDHVEIIRGATGLMSGTGNPGGSVNFIRKRPTREFQGSLRAMGGSYDTYRGEIDLSSPLTASGAIRARVVGAKERRGDTLDFYSKKRDVAYGIVEADLAPATTLSAGASTQRSRPKGVMWGGLPIFDTNGDQVDWKKGQTVGAKWTTWDTDSTEYFAQLEHGFANGWNGRLSYSRLDNDFDASLLFAADFPVDADTGYLSGTPTLRKYRGHSKQDVYGGSLTGDFGLLGATHEFNLGFSHSRTRSRTKGWNSSDQATYPVPNIHDWHGDWPEPVWDLAVSDQQLRTTQTGIFGTARFNLGSRLHLLTGARWTRWEADEYRWNQWSPDSAPITLSQSQRYSEITPYLGVTYDLDDTYTAYVSYTNIFQPQMYKTRDWNMTGPAYGHNYEAGIKASYLEGRLNGSFAVFQTNQKDVAEYAGFDAARNESWYEMLDDTRTRGFELELAGEVSPGWNLFLGYTYRVSKDNAGRKVQTTQPEQMLKASTTYRLPGALRDLVIGGGMRWQSRTRAVGYYGEQSAAVEQQPYALFDLMAQYDLGRQTQLQLNVRNLADKRYYRAMGFYNSVYYGEGRTTLVTLTHRF